MSKQDILSYLKKDKGVFGGDKSQNWIGTYNGRQMILLKFFKWLYCSNEPDSRLRKTPECMSGIKQLRKPFPANMEIKHLFHHNSRGVFTVTITKSFLEKLLL